MDQFPSFKLDYLLGALITLRPKFSIPIYKFQPIGNDQSKSSPASSNDSEQSSPQRSQTEPETEEDEMIATYDFKQNTVPSSELSSPSAISDLTRFGLNLDSKLRVQGNMDRTKPALTDQLLITLALKAKKNRQCTVEELMQIIGTMFPYFKKYQNINGWRKDLSSTLSDATKNKLFVRLTNQVSIYLYTIF